MYETHACVVTALVTHYVFCVSDFPLLANMRKYFFFICDADESFLYMMFTVSNGW